MIQTARITGIGFATRVTLAHKVYPRRYFGSSNILRIDSSNGVNLDNTQDIVDTFAGNKDGLTNYISEKKESIHRVYREESNRDAAAGATVEQLESLLEVRDDALGEFEEQIDDVMDLGDFGSTDAGDSPREESSSLGQERPSADTEQDSRFKQDSSEVESDYSPMDFGDE